MVRTHGPRQIAQRMPERREFPVEHRDHARLDRMKDQILHAVVAVRDRGLIRRGNVAVQPFDQPIHFGNLVDFRCLVLLRPARKLPCYVRLRTAVIAETDRAKIDLMQAREHVVHRVVAGGALGRVRVRHRRIPHDASFDEIHHEERGTDDASVLAQQMRARNRHVGGSERLDDSIFALDLMSRREQSPRRFLTHHETRVGSFEHECGIRLPADELSNGERTAKVRHLVAQVVLERGFVEAMILANWRYVKIQFCRSCQ